MSEWDDRRAETRIPVNMGQIAVLDPATRQPMANLANLSRSGLMLNATTPFTQGASYQVLLCWQAGDGTDCELQLGILMLWDSAAPGGSIWAGFQIIDISDADRDSLDRLIDSL